MNIKDLILAIPLALLGCESEALFLQRCPITIEYKHPTSYGAKKDNYCPLQFEKTEDGKFIGRKDGSIIHTKEALTNDFPIQIGDSFVSGYHGPLTLTDAETGTILENIPEAAFNRLQLYLGPNEEGSLQFYEKCLHYTYTGEPSMKMNPQTSAISIDQNQDGTLTGVEIPVITRKGLKKLEELACD